jgi:hypothetical protein
MQKLAREEERFAKSPLEGREVSGCYLHNGYGCCPCGCSVLCGEDDRLLQVTCCCCLPCLPLCHTRQGWMSRGPVLRGWVFASDTCPCYQLVATSERTLQCVRVKGTPPEEASGLANADGAMTTLCWLGRCDDDPCCTSKSLKIDNTGALGGYIDR